MADPAVQRKPDEYDIIWPTNSPFMFQEAQEGDPGKGEAEFTNYLPRSNGSMSAAEQCQLIRNKGDVFVAVNGKSLAGKPYAVVQAILVKQPKNYFLFRMRDIKYYDSNSKTNNKNKNNNNSPQVFDTAAPEVTATWSVSCNQNKTCNPNKKEENEHAWRSALALYPTERLKLEAAVQKHRNALVRIKKQISKLLQEQEQKELELAAAEQALLDRHEQEITRLYRHSNMHPSQAAIRAAAESNHWLAPSPSSLTGTDSTTITRRASDPNEDDETDSSRTFFQNCNSKETSTKPAAAAAPSNTRSSNRNRIHKEYDPKQIDHTSNKRMKRTAPSPSNSGKNNDDLDDKEGDPPQLDSSKSKKRDAPPANDHDYYNPHQQQQQQEQHQTTKPSRRSKKRISSKSSLLMMMMSS